MAHPVCRFKNSSVKTVCDFNLLFPYNKTEKSKGRSIVDKNWAIVDRKDGKNGKDGDNFFTTAYQLAVQMGMYYEDDIFMHPRFDRRISLAEAEAYILNWGKKYYAPNPYAKGFEKCKGPVVLNRFLVNWAIERGDDAKYDEALIEMFGEQIGNYDIVKNLVNNYMEVCVIDDKVVLKNNSIQKYSDEEVWPKVDVNDKKAFFDFFGDYTSNSASGDEGDISVNMQRIYYGAPGTGKSNKIRRQVDEQGKKCFRVTFHPDSDYSTFVGAYKPTMRRSERVYNIPELTAKLKEIKETGMTYPCQKFAAKYWESLKDLGVESIKQILQANGFTESMTNEIAKGAAVGQEYLNSNNDGKIVYSFVPQAFTKAYVEAWKTTDEVYLVIEEINRGNCAQIFGDLFQLLDRKKGVSEYPVDADSDLEAYLADVFSEGTVSNIPEEVKSGKKLILPDNLYIWATMNTSDQSLFPIDSAFKRRWDWKYIPIDTKKEVWYINVDGALYSWTDFLEKINNDILTDETAEDKHLGFYFCKAINKEINAETFVGKVLFYLWNDVFKVYGIPATIGSSRDWAYTKFYNTDGSIDGQKVKDLMKKLDILAKGEETGEN